MKPGAVVASSRSGSSSTVAFSWEQEPGVSKQSPAGEARKPTAGPGAARAEAAVSSRSSPPAGAKKQAPAAAHQHRLRVPPPPGGPGAPAGRRNPGSRRRVRPADDPFLAAYLVCTEDGGGSGYQKLLGWAGLGLGLGLSCKSSCGAAVEECVVRHAKIPGLDED